MSSTTSRSYHVRCHPGVLRRTRAEYALPEPPGELEEDVLPAFASAQGRVVLREDDWKLTAMGRVLRSVNGLGTAQPGWLSFPTSKAQDKKVRRALWWSSIVAPLSFFLETDPAGGAWSWFSQAWPEVMSREQEILRLNHRDSIEKLPGPLQNMLDFASGIEPGILLVGFFDEGCQAVVAGRQIQGADAVAPAQPG